MYPRTDVDHQVVEYLKSERQWTRQCRIERARMLLGQAALDRDEQRFWHEVIFKLTGSEK